MFCEWVWSVYNLICCWHESIMNKTTFTWHEWTKLHKTEMIITLDYIYKSEIAVTCKSPWRLSFSFQGFLLQCTDYRVSFKIQPRQILKTLHIEFWYMVTIIYMYDEISPVICSLHTAWSTRKSLKASSILTILVVS